LKELSHQTRLPFVEPFRVEGLLELQALVVQVMAELMEERS